MQTKNDKFKQGQTMVKEAFRKRQLAQALWDEAEELICKGRQLIKEAEDERG